MGNVQLRRLTEFRETYKDSAELSRALSRHFLALNEAEKTEFGTALIMDLCALCAVLEHQSGEGAP